MVSTCDLYCPTCIQHAIFWDPTGKTNGGRKGFQKEAHFSCYSRELKNQNTRNGLLQDIMADSTTHEVGQLRHNLKNGEGILLNQKTPKMGNGIDTGTSWSLKHVTSSNFYEVYFKLLPIRVDWNCLPFEHSEDEYHRPLWVGDIFLRGKPGTRVLITICLT